MVNKVHVLRRSFCQSDCRDTSRVAEAGRFVVGVLLQLRVLRFRGEQYGDVRVGVFPER
jgi:hypothetical protein